MMQDLAKKMHRIATEVDGLNATGQVKAQTGNEKGYAILFSVSKGCRVWAHHTRDNRLIIDLMFTKNEELKNPDVVNSAIATFGEFASKSNREITRFDWEHSISKSDTRTQYYFDITNEDEKTISELVRDVRSAFGTLPPPPSPK